MDILVIGTGVIGTIYGYILTMAGHRVVHYVRPGKLEQLRDGIKLDLLDGRQKSRKPIQVQDQYALQAVCEMPDLNAYELVVIPVRHYQLEPLLPELAAKRGRADFLFLQHSWEEAGELVGKFLPLERCIWGFPGAGGGFVSGDPTKLNGVLMRQLHLGEENGEVTPRLQRISQLFELAGIEVKQHPDIRKWLWKHFALNAGLSSAMMKAGGAVPFIRCIRRIHEGVLAARDAFEVVRSRGVDVRAFPDAKAFYMPSWLVASIFWVMLRTDRLQRTIFELYDGSEEVQRIYREVLDSADARSMEVPHLRAMCV